MKRMWILYGAAALFFLAGCGKSTETANQQPTAANQPNPNTTTGTANQTEPAQSAAAQEPEAPREVVVPAGTTIPVVLTTAVSSYKSQPGDEFEGSVAAPAIVDGEPAIPKGAPVRGTVVNAKKQGAVKGQASLSIRLTSIQINGREYSVVTNTFGAIQKGKGKRSALMTGGGAAVGALIGGLAGGGKGAAIGAGVGGGGGLAASAGTGGRNVELPAESRVTFKLTQPITIER